MIILAGRWFYGQDVFGGQSLYYRIRAGLLLTIRTRGGSQRVLLSSIEAFLEERRGGSDGVSDGDAGDEPAVKSPPDGTGGCDAGT